MASIKQVWRWFGGAALAAVAAWSVSARAAVPATLTEQGRILDSSGNPATGTVTVVFTIYDAATGGTSLWTETQSVQLDDGYFSTGLGEDTTNPIDPTVFDGSERYLGVKVGTDPEMTPRQVIRSVPYAFSANVADKAVTATTATNATNATNATTAQTANSVAFTNIANIPAPCAAGKYLEGYSSSGAAQCAALPALSCKIEAGTTAATNAVKACATGEIMTGGGCFSAGSPLTSDNPAPAGCIPVCHPAEWACTVASGNVTAYAVCCTVQ